MDMIYDSKPFVYYNKLDKGICCQNLFYTFGHLKCRFNSKINIYK